MKLDTTSHNSIQLIIICFPNVCQIFDKLHKTLQSVTILYNTLQHLTTLLENFHNTLQFLITIYIYINNLHKTVQNLTKRYNTYHTLRHFYITSCRTFQKLKTFLFYTVLLDSTQLFQDFTQHSTQLYTTLQHCTQLHNKYTTF